VLEHVAPVLDALEAVYLSDIQHEEAHTEEEIRLRAVHQGQVRLLARHRLARDAVHRAKRVG
jgi:hypothetical protein